MPTPGHYVTVVIRLDLGQLETVSSVSGVQYLPVDAGALASAYPDVETLEAYQVLYNNWASADFIVAGAANLLGLVPSVAVGPDAGVMSSAYTYQAPVAVQAPVVVEQAPVVDVAYTAPVVEVVPEVPAPEPVLPPPEEPLPVPDVYVQLDVATPLETTDLAAVATSVDETPASVVAEPPPAPETEVVAVAPVVGYDQVRHADLPTNRWPDWVAPVAVLGVAGLVSWKLLR